jgi:23S rRNA (guanosine2251-2'-O)-methyltransferase
MSDLIVGRHAVLETLRADRRRLLRLWVEGQEGDMLSGLVAEIHALAVERALPVRFVRGGLFERLAREQAHAQGVALETSDYPHADVQAILDLANEQHEPPFLLLLDHLQDPQNLGTLIRTAEAMGVHGVILPDRRAARVTPAVSNASAGAVEHLLVAQVTNLNRTIDDLKQAAIWVAGLDDRPEAQELAQVDLTGALALVVGAEGEGMSRLTRESCDFLVRIPMYGRIESLNAAVAGSIVLHAARQARAAQDSPVQG